jgi:ppGpp synthetase/RelA/SpoT-type nucleotidyltranferase
MSDGAESERRKRPTKSRANKAGEQLRRQLIDRTIDEVSSDPANETWWDIVEDYQRAHSLPTTAVALAIRRVSMSLGASHPVTRIKRAERIIEKIARSKSQLARLQDIGGCRIVVPDLECQVEAACEIIDLEFDVAKVADYVSARGKSPIMEHNDGPKGSGYRAIHIVHQVDDLLIETQIRTEVQHYWAMAAEKAEQITGYPLKFGDAPTDLLDYFRVASALQALQEQGLSADTELISEMSDLRERIRAYYRRDR